MDFDRRTAWKTCTERQMIKLVKGTKLLSSWINDSLCCSTSTQFLARKKNLHSITRSGYLMYEPLCDDYLHLIELETGEKHFQSIRTERRFNENSDSPLRKSIKHWTRNVWSKAWASNTCSFLHVNCFSVRFRIIWLNGHFVPNGK